MQKLEKERRYESLEGRWGKMREGKIKWKMEEVQEQKKEEERRSFHLQLKCSFLELWQEHPSREQGNSC